MALNELTIRNLKLNPEKPFEIVWDPALPRFGIRVGRRRKTYIVKQANSCITLGHYGVITLAEARQKARQALYAKYLPTPTLYAPVASEQYLKVISAQKKPNTVAAYSIYLRRLPNKPLTQLTPNQLYEALPEGESAANLCFKIFKAFLSWCVERDYLQSNPLLKRRQPNKLKTRDRLLTDDEVRIIWKETYNHSHFGAILRLLLLTGQRLNQIASLQRTWLTEAAIVFPAYAMKNSIEHTIPLTDRVRKELENYTQPKDIKQARIAIQKATPLPHWTPHDFRRYLSSTMSKLGVAIDITETILAHSTGSRSAIQRVYDRDNRLPQMRSALERYENHVFSLVERTE